MQAQGLDAASAEETAAGQTNLVTDGAVTVRGALDTGRYQGVLDAPGLVGVQGAGLSFDGFYYVKEVTHKIQLSYGEMSYKQNFTLTREGLGTTTPNVF